MWSFNDFKAFALQNMVRTNKDGSKQMRMLAGGLPWGSLLEYGTKPHCFISGITSDLLLPLQCAPRGLYEPQDEEKKGAQDEEKKDYFSEKNARLRELADERKQKGEACLLYRKIHHRLNKYLHEPNAMLAFAKLHQAMLEVQDVVDANPSVKTMMTEEKADLFRLSFWDFNDGSFTGVQDECRAYIAEAIAQFDSWMDELQYDEADGTFPVYPYVKVDKELEKLQQQVKGRVFDRPPVIMPLPVFVSRKAIEIGLQGNDSLHVASARQRGLGNPMMRDIMDDYRIAQIRDAKGHLHMITDWFPLMAFAENKRECVKEVKRALSKIMYTVDDRFEPRLIEMIVPDLLASLVSSLVATRNDGAYAGVDVSRFDLFPQLYYTVLETIMTVNQEDSSVFEKLYTSVMKLSYSRARHGRSIGSLPAFLCKMSVAGIPWAYVKEPFIREFFVRMVRKHPMREAATKHDYKNHLEKQCLHMMKTFLMILCFDGGQQNLYHKITMFRNNGGTLSPAMRNRVLDSVDHILRVKSLEEMFLLMGLVPSDATDHKVKEAVLRLIDWAIKTQKKPYLDPNEKGRAHDDDDEDSQIRAPKYEKFVKCHVAEMRLSDFWVQREKKLEANLKVLRGKHSKSADASKYPTRRLPKTQCWHCNEHFASRAEMFRTHLNVVFPGVSDKGNALFGRHAFHRTMEAPLLVEMTNNRYRCSAQHCREVFGSYEEAFEHLKMYGANLSLLPANKGKKASMDVDEKQELKDAHQENAEWDDCIVCFEAEVSSMFLPCGHQHLCHRCAIDVQKRYGTCPYCRAEVESVIKLQSL